VPLLIKSSGGDASMFETPIMIEEKDPWLRFSFVVSVDTPMGKLAKTVGWSKTGLVPITMRFSGEQEWPTDTSLYLELKRTSVTVSCALRFPTTRAHDLDAVERLVRLIEKHRRKIVSAETWTIKNGCLTQEWRIATGVTFGELSKALGVHTNAMLQWRTVILDVLEKGLDPDVAFRQSRTRVAGAVGAEVIN